MGMQQFPNVMTLENGAKLWQHSYERFRVKVYVPKGKPLADIVNFGFKAPYLLVFEENELSPKQAVVFAEQQGFAQIAAEYSGSVVFVYPNGDNGWADADEQLFIDLVAESRIGQYHEDGVCKSRDRFTKAWGECFLRGAIFRTFLYGWGKSADYIAKHCLKTLDGLYLWGPGEITPTAAVLERLSIIPDVQRRDIPVVSVGNGAEINAALTETCDHLLLCDAANVVDTFNSFLKPYKRWCGVLQTEEDMDAIGMVEEPSFAMVPTAGDNCGDDQGTAEHAIGYIAYYNKGLLEKGSVPLVLAFHGGGDSALHMAHVSGWYKVAQRNDFLLVCVENHLNSTATEVIDLLAHLKQKYPVDEKCIYASGFSMGGIKSWDLYQEYPQVFAALAPMSATVEVGHNVYFHAIGKDINRSTPVPVFYAGGEITPLPELPFQEQKCIDRVKYVLEVNQVDRLYDVALENKAAWENPIWGIHGDRVEQFDDVSRGSVLTVHYFTSRDGVERTAFASISGQGHECRKHTCEQAWQFMKQFKR